MEALHHAVGLGVVGRGHCVVAAKKVAQFGPQGAGELSAPVRDNALGSPVVLNPVVQKGSGTLSSGDASESYGCRLT